MNPFDKIKLLIEIEDIEMYSQPSPLIVIQKNDSSYWISLDGRYKEISEKEFNKYCIHTEHVILLTGHESLKNSESKNY